jgi:molybdopterin converting factor subunit 1
MEADGPAVSVTVLLFGPLRERVGQGAIRLDVPEGATTRALLDVLAARYESIRRFRSHLRLAVNGSYTTAETALRAGDEVALITPTSGG